MLAAVSAKRCFHPPPPPLSLCPFVGARQQFFRALPFSFAKTSFPRRNGGSTFYRAKNEDEGQDRFFFFFFFPPPFLSTVVEHNCIEGELVTRDTAACNRRHNWKHWPCLIFLFTPLANLLAFHARKVMTRGKKGGKEGVLPSFRSYSRFLLNHQGREYVLKMYDS